MIDKIATVKTDCIGENTLIKSFAVIDQEVIIGSNVIIHPHVTIEAGVVIGNNVEIFPGAYIGKLPKGAGAVARKIEYQQKVKIGDNSVIGPNAVIYADVTIGSNTLIGDNASIREQVIIGDFCIISRSVTINYNTSIGNRTKIMDMTHITGNCQIGNDVFISVLVATTNDRAIGQSGYDEEKVIGPNIGNGVAIGAGANILPGVYIGEGSVVAASAVVSKDVLPKKMVAGNPARVIKSLDGGGGDIAEYFVHDLAYVETEAIGKGTRIWAFTHILNGAKIGSNVNICDSVFIENDVEIGNNVTIKCGVQLWDGIRLKDNVFIGPNVTFTNDPFPRSKNYLDRYPETIVKEGASIGANATILPGVTIGKKAMIGAGAVVTKNIPDYAVAVGNPAKIIRYLQEA